MTGTRADRLEAVRALARADALRDAGRLDEALAATQEAARAGASPAAVAWRTGVVHHLRGELDAALAAYDAGAEDRSSATDGALVFAWRASARWRRGDRAGVAEDAERALALATAGADQRALAAAHTALALRAALEGDRAANERHYDAALDHAEAAADPVQLLRLRANRGSRLLEEGHFEAAIAELDAGLAAAAGGAVATLEALALTNRAEALLHLGRLDESLADLRAAQALVSGEGRAFAGNALRVLGDLHRARGEPALARAAYEEALEVGEAVGDRHALVPALVGLTRVLATEDPPAAAASAAAALADPGMEEARALLAAAEVALAAGDTAAAADRAEASAASARRRRDRATLADALTARAATRTADGSAADLEQAVALWRDLGDPVGEALATLRLAELGGGAQGAALAEAAGARLAATGARGHAARAAAAARRLAREGEPAVTVLCLGAFQVLRRGEPVRLPEWGSRKARDLLKLLVAARGRPLARDELLETLWPEEDPARSRPRLSVLLSTLRRVLDPGRTGAGDALVRGDARAVSLDLDAVDVDLERFQRHAGAALQSGDRAQLEAAERLYRGDAFEEDRYEEWAADLRDELRDLHVAVLRRLARADVAAADHDAAVRRLVRILEADAYDERAHLELIGALVAGRRHGEARRRYGRYEARMAELELTPAAFPGGAAGASAAPA